MTRNSDIDKELSSLSFSVRFGRSLRRYFITGLATLFPVVVTIWLVWQIFLFADGFLGNWLAELVGFKIPGLGLVMTILIIFLVGFLSIHFFGRVVFQTLEIWLSRLPLVKRLFPAVKQLAQFLFNEGGKGQTHFRGVVLVHYPRQGAYSLAFVTNESHTTVNGWPQTLLTIVLPNPPSPFTGPVILVPKEDVVPLDMPVEDAVKLIMSCGVVTPPLKAVVPVQP